MWGLPFEIVCSMIVSRRSGFDNTVVPTHFVEKFFESLHVVFHRNGLVSIDHATIVAGKVTIFAKSVRPLEFEAPEIKGTVS